MLDTLTLQTHARLVSEAVVSTTGRPPFLLEPAKVEKLLASLADGNYRETACLVAGIDKKTFYNTLKRAETGDNAAIAFVHAVEMAEAQAEAETVGLVRDAARKGPQYWAAGMTFLERKSPEKFGRRVDENNSPRVLVQIGAGTQDVTINVVAPSSTDAGGTLPQPLDVTPVYEVSNSSENVPGPKTEKAPRVRRANRAGDPGRVGSKRSHRG